MTSHGRDAAWNTRRGVTLLEVLAVIAIVGVIFALALPAIGAARERAGATRSLSNLRQIAGAFEGYIRDQHTYPFGQQGFPYVATYLGEPGTTFPHFEFDIAWAVLMQDHAPWDEFWRTMLSPGKTVSPLRAGASFPTSYKYANSFLARPQLWSDRVPDDPELLLRPVTPADVTYPSQKVLMWDAIVAYLREPRPPGEWTGFETTDPIPMLFVDGHAREHRVAEATDPVINPLRKLHPGGWIKLSNTRDGVRGRDFE